jgi:hypothetical protein
MRDQAWLELRFNQIWQLFFPDVEKKNVFIRWKGKWKNKFGHIKTTKKGSEIAINTLFQDLRVPEEVIKVTIAHEIVHYLHGFHSHLPRQFSHPHKGNVVNKELIKRGFKHMLEFERQWYKKDWLPIYKEYHKPKVIQPRPSRLNFLQFWQ